MAIGGSQGTRLRLCMVSLYRRLSTLLGLLPLFMLLSLDYLLHTCSGWRAGDISLLANLTDSFLLLRSGSLLCCVWWTGGRRSNGELLDRLLGQARTHPFVW